MGRKMNDDAFNSINVYKAPKANVRTVYSNNPLFEGYVVIKRFEGGLKFCRAEMDYRGKVQKFSLSKGLYFGTIVSDIPLGRYNFDEDSNEDMLIIYF